MAVLLGWQGRGVAARLLRSAESELQDRQCVRVTLHTSEPLKRATRFYLKNGYSPSGRVKDSSGMPLFLSTLSLCRETAALSGRTKAGADARRVRREAKRALFSTQRKGDGRTHERKIRLVQLPK